MDFTGKVGSGQVTWLSIHHDVLDASLDVDSSHEVNMMPEDRIRADGFPP